MENERKQAVNQPPSPSKWAESCSDPSQSDRDIGNLQLQTQLDVLGKKLAVVPPWKKMDRLLLETQFEHVKRKIDALSGAEEQNSESIPELAKSVVHPVLDPHKNNGDTEEVKKSEPAADAPYPGIKDTSSIASKYRVATGGEPCDPSEKMTALLQLGLSHFRQSIREADLLSFASLVILISVLNTLLSRNASTPLFKGIGIWSPIDYIALLSLLVVSTAIGLMLAVVYRSIRDGDNALRFLDAATKPENSLPTSLTIADVLQEELYEAATVCTAKYRALFWGFWVGSAAAIISVLYLILSKRPHPGVFF